MTGSTLHCFNRAGWHHAGGFRFFLASFHVGPQRVARIVLLPRKGPKLPGSNVKTRNRSLIGYDPMIGRGGSQS